MEFIMGVIMKTRDRSWSHSVRLAGVVTVLHALLLAGCTKYDHATALIAPQARYFQTPTSASEIPNELVDTIAETDILLLGESHYVTEHHQLLALLVPRLHERGFRLFLTEANHATGWVFDEYVTGRRNSLTPAQSSLDSSWLEAARALNAQLRAAGREREQMRVRAIDVNHWRSVYREAAIELAGRSGNEQLVKRIQALPRTDAPGYRESLESLAADAGAAQDRMGLTESDFATLKDMTRVEIVSSRFRGRYSWTEREGAMYDAIVAAVGSLGQGEKAVIHCGMMHAQLSHVWDQESFQSWSVFGVRLAEYARQSSKRIFSLACFGARGEDKRNFRDSKRYPFDIADQARADSLSRAVDAAANGRIAFVDLRNTGVTDAALIDFGSGMSSTARPGEQFSAILMYPRASVLPSSVWYETNFRD
ncbi:MAG: hypothetical protein ACK51N_02525 [bacterium]|nr:hypothetical protein [Actinomycetota bacterium]